MEDITCSCLLAIQKIKGETREEKFKEIGRIVKNIADCTKNESDIENAIVTEDVPNALVPLIRVLIGVKIKSHSIIIQALKSDDTYLITEALRARWFYDGSNRSITNYRYFSKEIFPYVSMSTRRKIIKKLSKCLGEKKAKLGEDFFDGIVDTYGLQEATILLPACRSDFIYETVIKHTMKLSNKMLNKLYRKYPNLVLRYLGFVDNRGKQNETDRIMYNVIDVTQYRKFVPLLITKHPDVFIKIQSNYRVSRNLGIRRSKMLLKHEKQSIIGKPRQLIELIPKKILLSNLTEEEYALMFGNLLDERWEMFRLNDMLSYLEYYPKDKRITLLRNKVKEKYGFDILDRVEKITTKFLLMLPNEERFNLVRHIIQVRHKVIDGFDNEYSWWCYLPTDEAIAALKMQIAKSWNATRRHKIFLQLIYVCKLNKSTEALFEVVKYIDGNCQYERSDAIINILDRITQEFDLDTFDERLWAVLFSLIKRVKLKKENARHYWILIKILKRHVHFCASHELPFDDIIDTIVRLFVEGRVGVSWRLLEDEAAYERKYLDICLKHNYWHNMDYKRNIVEGIYNFNERHRLTENSMDRLSLKNYPHLLEIVKEAMTDEKNKNENWMMYTKEKLRQHEPELYRSWFPEVKEQYQVNNEGKEQSKANNKREEQFEESSDEAPSLEEGEVQNVPEVKEKVVYVTEAIIALKKNFSVIKENWPQYYQCCKNEVVTKKRWRVKYFLKALRWYQDIPIKFAEKSIEENNFNLMAYLFDGATFSKLVENQLPHEAKENKSTSHLNALRIVAAVRKTSMPISLMLVEKYLAAEYMYSLRNYVNAGLQLWSYVAFRTSSDKMIALSKNLASKSRVVLKKHAIRVMTMMATGHDVVDFYKEMWQTEQHPLIRHILVSRVGKLFVKNPSAKSWNLVSICIADLAVYEDEVFEDLMGTQFVPNEYAAEYAEHVFKKLQEFKSQGMCTRDVFALLNKLFRKFRSNSTDYLSDKFYKELLTYYFKNHDAESLHAERFIIKVYMNSESVHFQTRLRHLSIFFAKESKRWYSLSLVKRKFSSNLVDRIVQQVVFRVVKFRGNLKLIENLYHMFTNTFTSSQHAWSRIMLFLCTEFVRAAPSLKNFGIAISEKIRSLVDIFSPEYFMHIIELLKEFIISFNFYEFSSTITSRLQFLEGLIEKKTTDGYIIAAKLLNQKIVGEYDQQYCQILLTISEVDNPIVQSLL